MPCGCSGKTSATPTNFTASGAAEYKYVDQSGQEVVRGTEMQARAAAIRDDNAGKVVPS